MGGVSSKAVRKIPKHAEPPAWAGARAPIPGEHSPPRPAPSGVKDGVPSGADPRLLSNLSQLGPVKVDHHMQSVPVGDRVRRAHESLVRSEREAAKMHGAHNRLLAGRLSALLDERTRLASRDGLEALAREYDVEVAKLESLARFVNVPDVRGAEEVRTVDRDGAERVTVKAAWTEPIFKTSTRQST